MTEAGWAGCRPEVPGWPPRRGPAPDPAAAPVHSSRRTHRRIWFLVIAVGLACTLVIGAALRGSSSGESPGAAPMAGSIDEHTHPDSLGAPSASGGAERDGADPRGSPPARPESETTSPVAVQSRRDGWAEAARGFGRAFTRTTVGQDAWFAALSTWLTPEQAAHYRGVPVGSIPTGLLREVVVADPADDDSTHGRLGYDTGMVLAVGLSYSAASGGWLVARVTLADSPGDHVPWRSYTHREGT